MPGFPHLRRFCHTQAVLWRDATAALLYPTPCRVCSALVSEWRNGNICARCWRAAELRWERAAHCAKCDAVLPALPAKVTRATNTCPTCKELSFTAARACGAYEDAVRATVLQLKRQPYLAPRLRHLLAATFARERVLHDCDALLPVPLHETRYAERTFNQAELLARALGVATGLPVLVTGSVRAKATERHGAGMGAQARAKSLHQAFRVHAPRLVKGRNLLIVDDVMTSGATAHELAQTLLASGAQSVSVFTLARATLFHLVDEHDEAE